MDSFEGKVAFVTGGASGIGFAMASALLAEGASVMLADVEESALATALERLGSFGDRVAGVSCEVAEAQSVQDAAERTFASLGRVQILCNNAGVSRAGRVETVAESDWDWVIGTNLRGVIHGLQAFLPHMREHREQAHVINTASISGLVPGALSGPYAATKFAIVGLSEVLRAELDGTAIGVSVVCPSWVRTRMVDNGRNRPLRHGGPFSLVEDRENTERNARYLTASESGLDPAVAAEMILEAVRAEQFYVFTHAEPRGALEARFAEILDSVDVAARAQLARAALVPEADLR